MNKVVSASDICIKLRNLMENDNSSIEDLIEVVSCDSQLTSAIVKIVNSDFFGFPGQIDTIGRAVNLLGIGQLCDTVSFLSEMESPQGLQLGLFIANRPPIIPEKHWS